MARIGIIGAMPEEIALLERDHVETRRHNRGMREYIEGSLYGIEAVLVFSRWGKVAAASTATTLLDVFDVKLIVFTGVAGAVAEDLEIGDVVIGNRLIQHDLDASALPGLKPHEVPLLRRSEFQPKRRLVDLAADAAYRYLTATLPGDVPREVLTEFTLSPPKVRCGLIVSGDQFVADPETLSQLRMDLPDAQCVEMEGAAIAQVCYEHNVPAVVIRTISDKADHSAVIDFPRFVDEVASHFSRGILKEFLARLSVDDYCRG
jgi:adenosylhomocysteine nucleosidase